MLRQRLHVISLLILTALYGSLVQAQAQAEQEKLLNYQQQLQQLQTDLQQYQTALSNAKTALASTDETSGPEQTELDEATRDLQEAQANFDADPSDDNKARVKNAEFKLALAERKYKKANGDQVELQEQVDQLTRQVAEANTLISKLNTTIAQQKVTVEQARARELATTKAREAEEQRRKAEAAQAEVARLKAQLAQQQREEAARKAAKAAAAEAVQATATAAAAAATIKAAPTPATTTAPAPAVQAVAEAPAKPAPTPITSATDAGKASGAILLSNKPQVATEQQRLNTLLATPDKSKSAYNKILNVKAITANGETGPAESNTLQALGHNQYKGTAELKRGDIMLIVGFNSWRQSIPAAGKYEVILDLSDTKNPRLVYYPQSLIK